jgi:hypothetical protein
MEELQSWIDLQFNSFNILIKTKMSTNRYSDMEAMMKSFVSQYNSRTNEDEKELLRINIDKMKKILYNLNKNRYKKLEKWYVLN